LLFTRNAVNIRRLWGCEPISTSVGLLMKLVERPPGFHSADPANPLASQRQEAVNPPAILLPERPLAARSIHFELNCPLSFFHQGPVGQSKGNSSVRNVQSSGRGSFSFFSGQDGFFSANRITFDRKPEIEGIIS
jgi:hypothetical protein